MEEKAVTSHSAYKKQRNLYERLLRKSKKDLCNNLEVKKVTCNKYFGEI